jgi:hypothetical protein
MMTARVISWLEVYDGGGLPSAQPTHLDLRPARLVRLVDAEPTNRRQQQGGIIFRRLPLHSEVPFILVLPVAFNTSQATCRFT